MRLKASTCLVLTKIAILVAGFASANVFGQQIQTIYFNSFDGPSSLEGLERTKISGSDSVLEVINGQMVSPQNLGGKAILDLGTLGGYDTILERNDGILVFGFNVSIENTSTANGGFDFSLSSSKESVYATTARGYSLGGGTMVGDRTALFHSPVGSGSQNVVVDEPNGVPDLPMKGSVKLTYNAFTNLWRLYIRVDSVYHDPITLGEEFLRDEAINNASTSVPLPFLIFGRAVADTCHMDNVSVSLVETGFTLQPPSQVSVYRGTPEEGINLLWPSATGATGYKVYRSETEDIESAVEIGDTAALRFLDGNIVPGRTYHYWIRSKRWTELSVDAVFGSGSYLLLPPSTIQISGIENKTDITLSWPLATGAESYQIYRSELDDPLLADLIWEGAERTFADVQAIPGRTYRYWVRSLWRGAFSQFSSAAEGMRGMRPATGLSATRGDYSRLIVLEWDASSGATEYVVMRGTSDVFEEAEEISVVEQTIFEDLSASNGQDYFYWVIPRSANSSGTQGSFALGFSSEYQPDLWLQAPNGSSRGLGVINSSGVGQDVLVSGSNRRPADARVWLTAIGPITDKVLMSGTKGDRRFNVAYFREGNVTAAMISGTLQIPLGIDRSVMRVAIAPNKRLRNSRSKESIAVAVSGTSLKDPENGDRVILKMASLPLRDSRVGKFR